MSAVLRAPPEAVWEDLRRIDRHVEWMHDAESISFVGAATEGVGVRFDCVTRIGPIRLTDCMEVTEWVEGRVMGIRHAGAVSGAGAFRLSPTPADGGATHTEFEWTESLRFPWWLAGPLGAALARPVLRAVWRRNLRSLAARFGHGHNCSGIGQNRGTGPQNTRDPRPETRGPEV